MKKTLKKCIVIGLCMAITGTGATVFPSLSENYSVTVSAATSTYQNFEYEVLSDDTVQIVKYVGADSEITIPSVISNRNVTKIKGYAFNGASSVKSVTLPETMDEVTGYSFYGCYNLKTVNIPASVKNIGSYAFEFCSKLENVNIAGNIDIVGSGAFYGCTLLSEFNFDRVSKLFSYSFLNTGLTSVSLPDNITFIGDHAMGFIYKNGTYTHVEGFTIEGEYDSEAQNYANTYDIPFKSFLEYAVNDDNETVKITGYTGSKKELTIPDKIDDMPVTVIGKGAFYDNHYIEKVTLPDTITHIGESSFMNCDRMTEIYLGKSLKTIDKSALVLLCAHV